VSYGRQALYPTNSSYRPAHPPFYNSNFTKQENKEREIGKKDQKTKKKKTKKKRKGMEKAGWRCVGLITCPVPLPAGG
jgi:hypothetical protein